jgi:hypothetical protein
MLQLFIYDSSTEFPLELARQIRVALLDEWPCTDAEDTLESLTEPQLHPTYFVLAEWNRLLSYARTIWVTMEYGAQRFKLYGLGDVMTVPQHRHKGYGDRIVREATAHIRSDPEADAALLLTRPELTELYQRSGWEHVPGLRVASSEDEGNEASNAFPMMLFLSVAARAARPSFARHTLVLPGDEW